MGAAAEGRISPPQPEVACAGNFPSPTQNDQPQRWTTYERADGKGREPVLTLVDLMRAIKQEETMLARAGTFGTKETT